MAATVDEDEEEEEEEEKQYMKKRRKTDAKLNSNKNIARFIQG